MAGQTYFEDFNDGPGGWLGWTSNAAGAARLEIANGVVICRSPWWVDYNHAPPGGGYLHLPLFLHTRETDNYGQQYRRLGGENRFIAGGFPTDFRNAKVTLRLKGELDLRGAQLLYHCQAKVKGVCVNYVLSGQPFQVGPQWSQQTVTLSPDPALWTCLGSRYDRTDFYGHGPIEAVLADLNVDMIFVLFPLNVVPERPIHGDVHRLKAGEDYPLRRDLLPEGNLMFDWVRIEFPSR